MTYQITNEDIEIICSQTSITKEEAKNILKSNKGDIVKSIIDIESNNFDLKKEEDKEEDKNDNIEPEVDLNNPNKLKEYREIVDEKDIIYQKKKDEKEKNEKEPKLTFCNEKKYFIKRHNEGNINIIHVL
jgi:hypothetical protein